MQPAAAFSLVLSASALGIGIAQLISESADGVRQAPFAGAIDFIANVFHIDVDDIGGGLGRHVPDFLEQRSSRHRPAGIPHHHLENRELTRRQIDPSPVAFHAPFLAQQRQIGHPGTVWNEPGIAPHQGLDSGQELRQRERLREAIVRAALERCHLVFNPAARRQNQDRRTRLCRPDLLDQADAVQLWQVQVEDQQIVTTLFMQDAAGRLAIVEDVDRVLLPLQFGTQETSQRYVIVDDQNLAAGCGIECVLERLVLSLR